MADWQPIETAPTREDADETNSRVVMAYFGPDTGYFGAAVVGYFFRWSCMKKRLPAGWPFNVEPTHWMPLPAPPALNELKVREGV